MRRYQKLDFVHTEVSIQHSKHNQRVCSRFYCLRIECAVDQAVVQVLLLARVEQLPLLQLLSSKQWAKLSICLPVGWSQLHPLPASLATQA